ncbi:M20 family metallopeptidase [soil metagenome]
MTLKTLAHAERDAYLQTLKALVTLESPTPDKAANDRVADYLETVLRADGWTVERVALREVGDQVVARFDAPGEVSSLLLCHFDTVWPVGTLAQMPLKEEDGKLYGPGTLDMKAGIATALHALKMVRRERLTLRGPVTLLLTSDEEKGSLFSREIIERLAQAHSRVFVLEPGREDGALKTGRKGTGDFTAHFAGVSAHAGNNPQDGASALRELAHFLPFAENLTDFEQGTTVNVTVAQGGSVSNVIAESATCTLDMRVLKLGEAERVEAALRAYVPQDSRVTVTLTGGLNRPPLEATEANKKLFEEAQGVLETLGLTMAGAVVGGGSDGNFTSALGVPTLDGLGSAGAGPHARFEHIRIDETLDRLALLTALLTAEE